ncbi:hypothetical protein JWG41_17175 [Leptospira sp. 201903075]|uniref:hypothetical protein n=1 Tax=Leptospira chreensis TaxID=2810035 RepID=UPI0019663BA5|nr:hypothetical protein [Leptospira chreensis]MBM9592180.1 hypothetical protein [Leptospira chreensis]
MSWFLNLVGYLWKVSYFGKLLTSETGVLKRVTYFGEGSSKVNGSVLKIDLSRKVIPLETELSLALDHFRN